MIIMSWFTRILALAIIGILVSPASAQQTRNQLNYFNNQNITTNGRQQITGAIENNLFGQIINGTALLNDTNIYSGSNTFNGPVTFNGSTNLSASPYFSVGINATISTSSGVRSGQKPDAKADYGAICDGQSHLLSSRFLSLAAAQTIYPYATALTEETDSAALAALTAQWRASISLASTNSSGITYSMEGLGICTINQTLPLYSMRSYLATFKFGGTQFFCNVAGGICVDGSMAQFATFESLSINGRPGANAPSVGLFIGRDSTNDRCNNNTYYNLTVVNFFSFAAVDNFACEVNTFVGTTISNSANNAYGLVQDGINHFGIASPTLGNTAPQNVANSLYSDIFIGGNATVTGTGSTPVWLAATSSNRFESFYTTATGAASATKANVYLYSYTGATSTKVGDENQGLQWLSHPEGGRTGNAAFFLFTGPNTTQNVMNLTFTDSGYGALINHFAADTGITSVNLPGFKYDVGNLHNGENVFDQSNIYTVQGFMNLGNASTAASWNLPATSWSGCLTAAGAVKCQLSGNFQPYGQNVSLSGSGVNISSAGPIASLTATTGGGYGANTSGVYTFPTVAISLPDVTGGTQATASITAWAFYAAPDALQDGGSWPVGGTGYTDQDVLTVPGGTCVTQPQIKVSVTGGVPQSWSKFTVGSCSVPPAMPVSLTGGTGSGATLSRMAWTPLTYFVTNGGTGYIAPTFTFSTGTYNNGPSPGIASLVKAGPVTLNGVTIGYAPTLNDYGAVGDGQVGSATWTGGSTAFSGISTSATDAGKLIGMLGAGVGGAPFQTTIASAGTFAAAPTYGSGTWFGYGDVCPTATPGVGVVPGDTFTLGAGTFNANTVCTTITTGVYGATVNSAGSGATATQCIVNGTTGTLTGGAVRFAATVNISGGAISSVDSTAYPGQYTTNPTITGEPVTSSSPGCNTLTGATLNLQVGVNLATLTTRGNTNNAPASPQTPTSTSGSSTGATFAVPYNQTGQVFWGTDNLNMIKNAMAGAPSGNLIVPAGVYMSSCPPSSAYWNAVHSVSLIGSARSSVFQLAPGCTQPSQNLLFQIGLLSNVHWSDITIDFNESTFANWSPIARLIGSGVYASSNGSNAVFERMSFLNMRSGQTGFQGFWGAGKTFTGLTVRDSYCNELTTNGNISHCIYLSYNGGTLYDAHVDNNIAVGTNIGVQAIGGTANNNDVSKQGYGPGIALGYSFLTTAANITSSGNILHDANNGVEVGDSDIPAGEENYCKNCTISSNKIFNMPGAGLKFCAQGDIVSDNQIWDNGGATGPNQATGSIKWQLNAGIVLYHLNTNCDTNATGIHGNRIYDSYTWAVAQGLSTAGLTPTQYYGISASGTTTSELDKIYATNDLAYNVQGPVSSNGSELIDAISLNAVGSKQTISWTAGTVAAATTTYTIGQQVNNAGASQYVNAPYKGVLHNLTARVLTAAVANPIVVTIYSGATAGGIASTPLTCSVAVGQTSCAIDTTASRLTLPAGQLFVAQINNGSTSATGSVTITMELDQLQ